MMLVDTHAHLDSDKFDADRDQVLASAWAGGVGTIISAGTDLHSSRQALLLAHTECGTGAQTRPHIYATAGIHPHEAAKAGPDDLAELERLSHDPAIVAIGEIGLDYYYNFSPPEIQRRWFIAQLELAQRIGRPVVIHDRDAHADTLTILHDLVGTPVISQHLANEPQSVPNAVGSLAAPRGVLHCFSGDAQMAWEAIGMGFYLSFGGPVTFANTRRLQALVQELPLEHILLETDCPYLAPHPQRGQRNEPAYVHWVAEKIADLKTLSFEQVAQVTTTNAARLFGFTVS
jgi:TatD DNase family protein